MKHGSRCALRVVFAMSSLLTLAACGQSSDPQGGATSAPPADVQSVPQALEMGGAKSVTRFFVTSAGLDGGNLGGLAGADAHCQALAKAEGSGDHTWRAYLSTSAADGQRAVNARDRIGKGPWYNAEGLLVAANVEALHAPGSQVNKSTALTEKLDQVNGVGDRPNMHDILTGSRPDGTAFDGEDLTCGNWTSNSSGRAQVGHHDRMGGGEGPDSWNSAHATRGCSQADFASTGGGGLFYCFAID